MKNTASLFLLIIQFSFGQITENVPKGFTKLGSLENTKKITFYLEKKTQTVLAYQNGKIKWKRQFIKLCGKPNVGKSEIRNVHIENNSLKLVYGKHSFASIEIETGKVICEGQD